MIKFSLDRESELAGTRIASELQHHLNVWGILTYADAGITILTDQLFEGKKVWVRVRHTQRQIKCKTHLLVPQWQVRKRFKSTKDGHASRSNSASRVSSISSILQQDYEPSHASSATSIRRSQSQRAHHWQRRRRCPTRLLVALCWVYICQVVRISGGKWTAA